MTKYHNLPTEEDIQITIVAWLRLRGWLVFEFAKGGTHRRLGGSLPVGFPDLVAIQNGSHVYFEVKAPKGRLSPAQEALHAEMREAGCDIFVVRSLEEVWDILGNPWGDE